MSRIQSWSPAAGLEGWQSPPSAGGRAAGIHLGQVEGLRNVGGEPPAPARGAASGSREHKGGGGSGPDSGKPHAAALEEPAFWVQQHPERSVEGHSSAGRQAEAHTTEGPMGRLLARTFLASYGECVPVPLFNPGFSEKFPWAITVKSFRSGQRRHADTL